MPLKDYTDVYHIVSLSTSQWLFLTKYYMPNKTVFLYYFYRILTVIIGPFVHTISKFE